ncbi:hypothetical protein BKA64DRAFT_634162 [Cadophora sp. MPI-SDFR-AT-0126]|nr:hypothetical protein BKA64DRAFT_634162 [Leotiomycetes sp. MPI-SDFR-AT-0126]
MQLSKLFTILLITMGVAAAPAANPEPAPGAALEAAAPIEERNLHKCGKDKVYSHKKKQCIPKNQCKKKYYKKNMRTRFGDQGGRGWMRRRGMVRFDVADGWMTGLSWKGMEEIGISDLGLGRKLEV